MRKILANLTIRQRITIALAAILVGGALYSLVRWRREADFRPLFADLAPEDAAGIVQKLKEGGVEYRLDETGKAVLAPSARIAELRLGMAAAGLPKTGRIGFELFDKTNLGATEFAEQVNYHRALEGELERSVMSLSEVEQARVHLTFAKDSVYLEEQRPAKASVLVRLRPGGKLTAENVMAIDHLVSSGVEGLSPDAVSVLDMNGNLLGRSKPPATLDGSETSEASLEYRRKVESDLVAKIDAALEPLLGAEKFRAGASVDCDFTGGEQSEEIFDPARSVMVSSQRTEDQSGGAVAAGVPGTASTLPRPTSRPGTGSSRVSRMTENIAYQSSRTVKKTRLPAGMLRKMSLAVLVDQTVNWEKDGPGFRRVLIPPAPEKLKIIHDVVAGVTGLNTDRGDQLIVETLPFENTLLTEPPQTKTPGTPAPSASSIPLRLDPKTLAIAGAALLILAVLALMMRRRRGAEQPPAPAMQAALPAGAPAGGMQAVSSAGAGLEQQIEAKLAERDALQKRVDAQALNALKIAPAMAKTSEVLAKHLREKVKEDATMAAHVLQSWIREDQG
jgi:flagellar M-ring protein FliF